MTFYKVGEKGQRGVTPRLREMSASCKKNQKTVKGLKRGRATKHDNHKFKI